jgi:hypothetical protein
VTADLTGQRVTASWTGCGTLFGTASGSNTAKLTDSVGNPLVYTATSAFIPNVTI